MENPTCPVCGTRFYTSSGMCRLHSVAYNRWALSVPEHKYMTVEERLAAFTKYQVEQAIPAVEAEPESGKCHGAPYLDKQYTFEIVEIVPVEDWRKKWRECCNCGKNADFYLHHTGGGYLICVGCMAGSTLTLKKEG